MSSTKVTFLQVKPISSSKVNVNWTASGSTASLLYSRDDSFSTSSLPAVENTITHVANAPKTSTSYNIAGLSENTLYFFKVVPYDANGNQGTSKTIAFKTSYTPSISTFRAQTISFSSVRLAWTGKFHSVDIYYQLGSTTTRNTFYYYATVSGENFSSVVNLSSNTLYTFYIVPKDALNYAGTQSSYVAVTTDYTPEISSFVLAESSSGTTANFTIHGHFADVSIEQSTGDGTQWSPVSNNNYATTASGSFTFAVSNLTAGNKYWFRAWPFSALGNQGAVSTSVTVQL